MTPGPILTGLLVRGENLVFLHPVIIKEPVGSFDMIPGAAGLRNGGGRLFTKFLGNANQALDQAGVSQGGVSEFHLGPSFACVLRQIATLPRLRAALI